MTSVNNHTIVGRLGKNPIIKPIGDTEVANFSVATQRSWFNKTKDKWDSKTTWHLCVVWKPCKQLKEAKAGDLIYIIGYDEDREWKDDKNETRSIRELIAEKHWMIPKNKGKAFETEEAKHERKAETGAHSQSDKAGFPDDPPF